MTTTSRHILFICTEDWFFQSHFLPLNEAARSMGSEYNTTIICGTGAARKGLEKLGIRVLPFDFARRSTSVLLAVRQFWHLAAQIRKEQPDIIHFIALRPVLVGGLVSLFYPKAAKVYHVTGLGTIAEGKSLRASLFRTLTFSLVPRYLKQRNSILIVENPDDLRFLRRYGAIADKQVNLFGGAGVDEQVWSEMPPASNEIPRVTFVGRMIWTKGVDVLIEAIKIVNNKVVKLRLDLYGEPDQGNPKEISIETLRQWNRLPGVTWHGRSHDVQLAWRQADISVVPTRTREGMPRSMLEAAACGRPQIVTDVPGCRHFVRDGVEGFVVPPENPQALAGAMKKMADDPELRHAMGKAARKRVLDGFTEAHVRDKARAIYTTLLQQQ